MKKTLCIATSALLAAAAHAAGEFPYYPEYADVFSQYDEVTPEMAKASVGGASSFIPSGLIYYVLTPNEGKGKAELWRYDLDARSNEKVTEIEARGLEFAQISRDGNYLFYGLNRIYSAKLGAIRLDVSPGAPREEFVLHFEEKQTLAFYDDWESKLYFEAWKRGKEPEDVVFSEGLLIVLKAKEMTFGSVDFRSESYEVTETPDGIKIPAALSEDYFYSGGLLYEEGISRYWRTLKNGGKKDKVMVAEGLFHERPVFLNGEKTCLVIEKEYDEPGQPLALRLVSYLGGGVEPAIAEFRLPKGVIPTYVQSPEPEMTGIVVRKLFPAASGKSGRVEEIYFLDALEWEMEFLFAINVPPLMWDSQIIAWTGPSGIPRARAESGLVNNLCVFY